VTVTRAGAQSSTWHPAQIHGGAPDLLTGSSAKARLAEEQTRFSAC
jgi:hypothetical protein